MSDPQRFVCVHGHFYQPPRENAWLEAIEVQDSAAPFHDWNVRINHECYAANGSSRILNTQDKIVRIVNNYSRMSFNFGPTLLAWMEKFAPLSYGRVIDADRASMERFGGHGSAIAQVYNHIIMPLAATEDRITQVRWGIADFEHRFHRKPEGMWLAETAVDLETLDLLAQHGIRFTILAPHQCARVRELSPQQYDNMPAWQETPQADVDPTQPYTVYTREGRSIAVFFYDGPISRAIAFEGLLSNGGDMARSMLRGYRKNDRAGQLVHIATDGESYGHHHKYGDMALAYSLQWIEENSNVRLTNYGQFLETFPPTQEAEIHENTSWSCSHGIDRWRADCGCGNLPELGWSQKWRAPLRAALDGLRDGVRPLWKQTAAQLLKNPQAARDAYIQVILDRTPASQQKFLDEHGKHPPCAQHLKLMELERHIQLMYTSCGWFFDDLAGIETVQIISYAARVLELATDLFSDAGAALEAAFQARIAMARGNAAAQPTGAEIYRKSVAQKISLEQVAARYAIVSLFEPQPEKATQYCYDVRRESGEVLSSGHGRFAYGQAEIGSQITLDCAKVDYAVLHLGDQNLSAVVRRTGAANGSSFQDFAREIREAVNNADLPEAMRLFGRDFGSVGYSLSSLFRDDQQRILKILLDSTLGEMEGSLRIIYENHVSLLRYLTTSRMPKPQALLLAAQFTLNAELRQALLLNPFDTARVRQLLAQIRADQIELDEVSLAFTASARMLHAVEELPRDPGENPVAVAIEILDALRELPFQLDLWETQNRWYKILPDRSASEKFRELGTKLDIEVDQLTVDD
jgi:alpha-amylase/alpha-mannosidase (GH57 family)